MAMTVGQTAPYRASNGHLMVAPLIASRYDPKAAPRPVWSWAECTPDCRACAAGDREEWYAGEEW